MCTYVGLQQLIKSIGGQFENISRGNNRNRILKYVHEYNGIDSTWVHIEWHVSLLFYGLTVGHPHCFGPFFALCLAKHGDEGRMRGRSFFGGSVDVVCYERWAMLWVSYQIRKIMGVHAPGMPETFPRHLWLSDPGIHHGTCVTHVPWCMPRSLTSSVLWRRRGKMFPAFPVHAQPTILRIW